MPKTLERFVLAENLRHLQAKRDSVALASRATLEAMIAAAARELALFDAAASGVASPWDRTPQEELAEARAAAMAAFDAEYATSGPTALIDPRPGLVVAAINPAAAGEAAMSVGEIAGKPFFALFPDNPDDPSASGVANLYASLRKVADSGREDLMPVQRYDIRDADGAWRERYWRVANRPVTDAAGRLLYVLHISREDL